MKKRIIQISHDQQENLRWILNSIFYNTQCGRDTYVITSSIVDYAEIFNKYAETYHKVCPAAIFSDKVELKSNDVLCVHDLFGNFQTGTNIADVIRDNYDKCDSMYITILGDDSLSVSIK